MLGRIAAMLMGAALFAAQHDVPAALAPRRSRMRKSRTGSRTLRADHFERRRAKRKAARAARRKNRRS